MPPAHPNHAANASAAANPDETEVRTFVQALAAEYGRAPEHVLTLLQAIQNRFRYLPQSALRALCEFTDITPARLAGVVTFYNMFRLRPVGRYTIKVCHGTACHVAGAPEISRAVRETLGIAPDSDTTPDARFTVTRVACLGCCSLAPVVQIENITYGHLTPGMIPEILDDFLARADRPEAAPADSAESPPHPGDEERRVVFRVGIGSCCVASGSGEVRRALEAEIRRLNARAVVRAGGCIGMCHRVPIVEVRLPDGREYSYARVTPELARRIVTFHAPPRSWRGRLRAASRQMAALAAGNGLDQSLEPARIDPRTPEVRAFLGKQRPIVLEHAGRLDPLNLEEYQNAGGFAALLEILEAGKSETILDALHRAGLRGRGGAGFPTARKWRAARQAPGQPKYVICNGDEGDPGAFMDRMILESYPFSVLEGMLFCALAIGASRGIVYVRAEYPVAVRRVENALNALRNAGLLGDRIGKGTRRFSFDIEIRQGAGAFVSGEETALIAALEGRRGSPRFRPPFPAEHGLHGRPTVVNNVETFACIPWIFRHGPEAFAALGTEHSRGSKVFALAGRVQRGGLIEVPMGTTIEEIVMEIGGGIRDGRRFKAVQIGGPSGGCIPARLAHVPIDYEALQQAGAIMGSGGMVVLDDRTCMVDLARFFLRFTQDESCGKCTFCRIGAKRMLEILERICAGEGREGDLERLEELARKTKDASLCGLGRTAPNPVLTTLRYFRDEYQAHLEGHCPAGVCPALITFRITDRCIGCTLCAQHCPVQAIPPRPYEQHQINTEKCIRCGTCRRVCPEDAVVVE